jgi:hypothetical protein
MCIILINSFNFIKMVKLNGRVLVVEHAQGPGV